MNWDSIGLVDPGDLSAHGIKGLAIALDGADFKVSAEVEGQPHEIRIGAASGFGALDVMTRATLTNSLIGALMRAADPPEKD